MTREEAIKGLKNVSKMFTGYKPNEEMFAMAIKALEQKPCEDWYDVPSNEMTLEQARQAVKDLRKKLAEYLEQQPCEDCISRQAVLKVLKNNRYRFNISQEGNCEGKVLWSENLIKDDACNEIEQLSSVTPKEKIGHWIDNADKIDAQFGKHTYKCSECGNYAEYFISGTEVWWDRIKPNFCPNCGARMVSE